MSSPSMNMAAAIAENFKEWFKPTPKAVSSRMTVDWQPPYKVLWQNLRDLISPPKLPPLKVTSQPVKVKEIWSKDKAFGPSQAIALAVHVGITVLIFLLLLYTVVTKATANPVNKSLVTPLDISDYAMKLPPGKDKAGGGGGEAASGILSRQPKVKRRSSVSTRSLRRWCTPSLTRIFRRLCSGRRI